MNVKARLTPIKNAITTILDDVKIAGRIVSVSKIPGANEAPNTMQIIGINRRLKNI